MFFIGVVFKVGPVGPTSAATAVFTATSRSFHHSFVITTTSRSFKPLVQSCAKALLKFGIYHNFQVVLVPVYSCATAQLSFLVSDYSQFSPVSSQTFVHSTFGPICWVLESWVVFVLGTLKEVMGCFRQNCNTIASDIRDILYRKGREKLKVDWTFPGVIPHTSG